MVAVIIPKLLSSLFSGWYTRVAVSVLTEGDTYLVLVAISRYVDSINRSFRYIGFGQNHNLMVKSFGCETGGDGIKPGRT